MDSDYDSFEVAVGISVELEAPDSDGWYLERAC
jgi:hypothetical protein